MKLLIRKIKEKKELSGLDDSLVIREIEKYTKKYSLDLSKISPSNKAFISEIRKSLRSLTGQFQKSTKSRQTLLDQNKIKDLLKTHSSTAERLDFYSELKEKISSLKPSSILDLACGLNPIALATPKIKYHASDIKADELSLINQYFKDNKIQGSTFVFDLREESKFNSLPKTDLCLLFKVLDLLDNRVFLSKKLIEKIKAKNILVSFPTKKLSGKPMFRPRRLWFEKILKDLNLPCKTFQSDNEFFYLIEKSTKK